MAANDWFCQFLADILDIVVERPANLETTALGAAMLAAHASGAWADALGAGDGAMTRFTPRWPPTAAPA
jgi:glycerol kinase